MNGSSDWRDFRSDEKSVPDSCCVKVTLNCGVGTMTDAAKVHQEVNCDCFTTEHLKCEATVGGNVVFA